MVKVKLLIYVLLIYDHIGLIQLTLHPTDKEAKLAMREYSGKRDLDKPIPQYNIMAKEVEFPLSFIQSLIETKEPEPMPNPLDELKKHLEIEMDKQVEAAKAEPENPNRRIHVLCGTHGRVEITWANYMQQMRNADDVWRCPTCNQKAQWGAIEDKCRKEGCDGWVDQEMEPVCTTCWTCQGCKGEELPDGMDECPLCGGMSGTKPPEPDPNDLMF